MRTLPEDCEPEIQDRRAQRFGHCHGHRADRLRIHHVLLRVLDDLEAGKHATNYGRVSGKNLDSAEWLQRAYLRQGRSLYRGWHFLFCQDR